MIYKIILKILASQLKGIIVTKIIAPYRSAFVPGSVIQDNSTLAHELFFPLPSNEQKGE